MMKKFFLPLAPVLVFVVLIVGGMVAVLGREPCPCTDGRLSRVPSDMHVQLVSPGVWECRTGRDGQFVVVEAVVMDDGAIRYRSWME